MPAVSHGRTLGSEYPPSSFLGGTVSPARVDMPLAAPGPLSWVERSNSSGGLTSILAGGPTDALGLRSRKNSLALTTLFGLRPFSWGFGVRNCQTNDPGGGDKQTDDSPLEHPPDAPRHFFS